MAKRKQSKPKKQGSEQELTALGKVLTPAIQRYVMLLMKLSGAASQAEFATGTTFDANDFSRYKRGKAVPEKHLLALGERAGLTKGQAAWLLGKCLTDVNEEHRLDLDKKQPDEIREPASVYDDRSLSRQLDAIMTLDFTPLGPFRMVQRNQERNRLRKLCEQALAGIEREHELLLDLLRCFLESSEDELRRAGKSRKSQP